MKKLSKKRATRAKGADAKRSLARRKPATSKAKRPAKVHGRSKPQSRRASVKKLTTKAKTKSQKSKAASGHSSKQAASKQAASKQAALKEGAKAPTFELYDHDHKLISSESLKGRPYILYFYPKDNTPGCTQEACDFRDNLARFARSNFTVLGVSPDTVQSHKRFRDQFQLPFKLISDPEKTLAKAYGVWVKKQNYGREYMGIARSTFIVDEQGRIRKQWRAVKVPGHVEKVLASAKAAH